MLKQQVKAFSGCRILLENPNPWDLGAKKSHPKATSDPDPRFSIQIDMVLKIISENSVMNGLLMLRFKHGNRLFKPLV